MKQEQRRMIGYWVPVLGYAALIFYLSSLTHVGVPLEGEIGRVDPGRLVFHIIEYSMLGYLLLRALVNSEGLSGPRFGRLAIFALAVFLGSLYGVTDELHQHFVPNRSPSVGDWMGDTIGSFVGSMIGRIRYRMRA